MKTIGLIATLLFSVNSFASTSYIHCQSISLSKDYQPLELNLSGEGTLSLASVLGQDVSDKNGDRIEVKGLKAVPVKITEVDTFTKRHFGFGGAVTTQVKVSAVKFHVSADEAIATEIRGCIPQEINAIDAYTICQESVSVRGR